NPEVVEQMLRASYRGEALAPTWTHSGDGREHRFAVAGIERQAAAAALQLTLAGSPIGAQRGDERTVSVPPLGRFTVIDAQAMEDEGRKQIRVTFSDALDEGQNLRGLVRLSSGEFTTRIDGNRLIVYPPENAAGELAVTLEPGIRNGRDQRLAVQSVHVVTVASAKPQVRFVGSGTILPDAKLMT